MADYLTRYNDWLYSDKVDDATKEELRSIAGNDDELKRRFKSYMEFGTAGLRSKMGAGCGMMNTYTVAHATEALARAIEKEGEDAKKRGVILGFDSRHNSEKFARRCAEVLTSHGIKVYLFDELRPTPMLSAGVRHFKCIAGINITASHNPSAYNGYKLYWEDGAQPTAQIAGLVASIMNEIDIFEDVPCACKADDSLITMVGKEFDEYFIEKTLGEQVYPDVVKKAADKLKIVYTPLCGAGYRMVPTVLKKIGIKNLYPVECQMTPDGDFPGLEKPNPEYPAAFKEGIKIATEVNSDLIIANDPDCDRIGVMARDKSGEFKCVTGNQMGSLLLDYIISALEEQGKMPDDAFAVKTIVSSEMPTKICEVHGVKLYNCLTGFKYIAEVVNAHEKEGTFLIGYEESYGYMKGSYARDKDGVVAAMLICEMASFYALRGMTLIDAIDSLYEKYGFYMENAAEIYMEGLDGKEQIAALMDKLRTADPTDIAGSKIISVRDYQKETIKNMITGEITGTGLPKSNVIYFLAENGCVVVARPSGTEPKIKFYILANGADEEKAVAATKACTHALEDWLGMPHDSLKK